jgi:hypothetical protein
MTKESQTATPFPFEEGYKHGLTGCDPRCNPYTDGWKEHAEWMRGHNAAIELWRAKNEQAN